MSAGWRPAWVSLDRRRPTAEDADQWGCVLIWDINNGVMLAGWRNEQQLSRPYVTHWARTPEGPCGEEIKHE